MLELWLEHIVMSELTTYGFSASEEELRFRKREEQKKWKKKEQEDLIKDVIQAAFATYTLLDA